MVTSDGASPAAAAPGTPPPPTVAIVGGGIAGAVVARTLLLNHPAVRVDLFDQGRSGVGGRASHRRRRRLDDGAKGGGGGGEMRWDHGCQLFRADTPRFRALVARLVEDGRVKTWEGKFAAPAGGARRDFFGFPHDPPFYVGGDGMADVVRGVLDGARERGGERLRVHEGTRVANVSRDPVTQRWRLTGTSGAAAYHDTPERVARAAVPGRLGEAAGGYDVVVLTDVSSSFDAWHRASAGVPPEFAARVRARAGARVPLFAATICVEERTGAPFDAAAFNHDTLWFAARSGAKPGLGDGADDGAAAGECWTLVSTPEYALREIEATPMQDAQTGEFVPQPPDYLRDGPGADLLTAFAEELTSPDGVLGDDALAAVPPALYVDAQRWGSALPAPRHLDATSATRRVIAGVPYDSGVASLSPTRAVECRHGEQRTFVVDEALGLIQAGDMVSTLTPGFEGAAVSGMDAAEFLLNKFSRPGPNEADG